MNKTPIRQSLFFAYIVCILGATFYLYEFALQVSISVITKQLMVDLALNAATLSIVSACFYYAYTFMQVPAGLLHDRFGPHRVLTFAILFCSFGAIVFSNSYSMWHAATGRFLMGIGAACSFTGALILITHWFPPRYFPILSGVVQLMSSIGAIFGAYVIALAVDRWHWRHTIFALGFFGFVLAFVVWFVVRDAPASKPFHPENTEHTQIHNLKFVMANMQNWWIALYSFLVWAPIVAFAALWGIPFLVTSYQMSTEAASLTSAAIWVGIGVSAPMIGYISERIRKRSIVLSVCAILGLIGTFFIIYFDVPKYLIGVLLFMLGIGGSGQSLAFSVIRDINSPQNIGAAIGLNNMATVAGGAIVQPVVGFLMQLYSITFMNYHVPIYSVEDYRLALFIIPMCYIFAAIVSFKFIKETYCENRFTSSP